MTGIVRVVVALIAIALGVGASVWWQQSSKIVPDYLNTFPEPRTLADFTLFNQDGKEVTKRVFDGYWSLLFSGYTYCPDVCPTTLSELNQIYPQLQQLPSKDPIQVVFLSVDPLRDTPQRLHDYIQFFNPDFIALTGPHTQLFPLARSMGMMYAVHADETNSANESYLVDHSASVVLINPLGQAVGRFKPEYEAGKLPVSNAEKILADMAQVTKGG